MTEPPVTVFTFPQPTVNGPLHVGHLVGSLPGRRHRRPGRARPW